MATPKQPFIDPDALHLEALRLSPTENAWRCEIENILDGIRGVVIEHRGDAGGYVEDLIRQAQIPAVCRIAFLDALERQVAQWKPPRGSSALLELLQRFTPRSGFPRLVELFRSPSSFQGDPPLADPQFHGRDLRLTALHVLERYIPVAPLHRDEKTKYSTADQEAFATYVSILRTHLHFPRYQHYVLRVLKRTVPDDVLRLIVEEVEAGSTVSHSDADPDPLHIVRVLELFYASSLRAGMIAEESLRRQMQQQFSIRISYAPSGPILKFRHSSLALSLDREIYERYFEIYMEQNRDLPETLMPIEDLVTLP
jgi:hypothetical protein